MHELSASRAAYTPENGLDIARWAQFPEATSFPFGAMWYVVPPASASRPDRHPETEVSVVVRGEGEFEAGGLRLPAVPGAAVVFPSEESHVIHNKSATEPLVVLSVYWLPTAEASAS